MRFSTETDEAMTAMRLAGRTAREISVSTGLPVWRVNDRLMRLNVRAPMQERRVVGRDLRQAADCAEALPAGHPLSWGVLTAGTSLAGSVCPGRYA